MRALLVALLLLPGAARADGALLRVESGPRVIQFEAGEVAGAELGLSPDAGPMVAVRLAPGQAEDWRLFSGGSAGQGMVVTLCGEPVGGLVPPGPLEDGVVPIPGGDEAARRAWVALLRGEAACGGAP